MVHPFDHARLIATVTPQLLMCSGVVKENKLQIWAEWAHKLYPAVGITPYSKEATQVSSAERLHRSFACPLHLAAKHMEICYLPKRSVFSRSHS